jgi:hypothetical protein
MLEIDVEARSAAPPERVWALLADVRTWPRWAPFDEAEVESGQGVGEIRRFRAGRVTPEGAGDRVRASAALRVRVHVGPAHP